MAGPPAPGSSEFTFLNDLRDALLPFVTTEHADNVQLHLDLAFGLGGIINVLNAKLDILHTDEAAVNATVQLLNLQLHTDLQALLTATNAFKAQAHTDSAAVLAKLEAIRLVLLLP